MKKTMWNDENFLLRITDMKEKNGMTWQDIADILNKELGKNYSESSYRKRYKLVTSSDTYMDKASENLTNKDDQINQSDALMIAKKQYQDQRREYNKILTTEARFKHIEEELLNAAIKLNEEKKLIPVNDFSIDDCGNDALLCLSDWHYGMIADNIWNKFDTTVCRERVAFLAKKVNEYCQLHKVNTLYIAVLGDLFHGSIHVSCRVGAEENTCEQLMSVSELLAEFINDVSDYVSNVKVFYTYGNHGRSIQNKKESIHSDNMERLVPWWLYYRLSDNDKVEINLDTAYEFILMNIKGHDICCVHGDNDSFKKLNQDAHIIFNKACGKNVEYVFSGDKHHVETYDSFGVYNNMVGSLCGTDEYSNNKRLYSVPSQTFCIFNEPDGQVCTYNIKLK